MYFVRVENSTLADGKPVTLGKLKDPDVNTNPQDGSPSPEAELARWQVLAGQTRKLNSPPDHTNDPGVN
ncbi:hypothetical protein [Nocardia otitidiscaviarum]|uniref:hypothetical protein n=1 Tax=Nocardia otitidiscaviarum TaxID=1823 RepID=UPI00031E1563|nr:hypothetical protein [Nocardia otitidiscaviarum]